MSDCSFFQLHVGGKIDLGSFARFVTKPKSNDAAGHTAAQQSHGCGVSKRVRFHPV